MEITQKAGYFESNLVAIITGLNNNEIDLLTRGMVTYAKKLEEVKGIPPGKNQDSKPKPGEEKSLMSPQYQEIIASLSDSISPELLTLLEDFLTYIKTIEALPPK